MKNKFVVYTGLFGDYDDLIEPNKKYEGCDFICFTDQKYLKSNIWEIVHIDKKKIPNNMMNRQYKIFPHIFLKEYTQSLYIDANIRLTKNPIELAVKYLVDHDIAIPIHKDTDCLYKEAKACVIAKKSDLQTTVQQMQDYINEGYPLNNGLTENHIILRNHNEPVVIKTMECVWNELNRKTQRDQLCLLYCAWKNKLYVKQIKETAWNNSGFYSFCSHKDYANKNILQKILVKLEFLHRRLFYNVVFKYKYGNIN